MKAATSMIKDPVCGMKVDPATALQDTRDGKMFYFCGKDCREKFLAGAKPEEKSGGCCG